MSAADHPIMQAAFRGRYTLLLVCFLLLFAVYPMIRTNALGVDLLDVLLTAMLMAVLYAEHRERGHRLIALLLGLPTVGANWLYYLAPSVTVGSLGDALLAVFFAFASYSVLYDVLSGNRVTFDKVAGGICVYLLIAMVFAMGFSVLEVWRPNSFHVDGVARIPPLDAAGFAGLHITFVYYSMITLTTTGFGDITPSSQVARSLTSLEAIIGVLYLAVLLSRLVALQVAHSQEATYPDQ